jgi:hypothetical protein
MDKQEVSKLLGIIAEHFPNFQFSPDTVDAWHLVLNSITFKEAYVAYDKVSNLNPDFAPSVKKIYTEAKIQPRKDCAKISYQEPKKDKEAMSKISEQLRAKYPELFK